MTMDVKKGIEAMSLPATGTIRQAMHAINQGGLGMALLISPETKCFVGLVTDGDIRRALLNGYGLESPVATVPRPEPKTARVGMSSEQVAALFSEPVRVVPLLNDAGQVVDIAVFDRRVRLPVAEPSLGEKELLYISECVLTGWVSSAGKFVTRFEEMFAEFCGTRHAITTSSGTTALHLAVLALNISSGDEVIVPTLTFIATANAVTYTGARPVFVDSELETWNIDPNEIESAINSKTKAIISVHLYGHPANMDPILQIARKRDLKIIEDAAEAHGAYYRSNRVGSIGDIGCFSFYGNKTITTGEGGMIVTNNKKLADRIRILRDHGMSPNRRYWHPVIGYNYRMTNLQAAIGVAQMEKINTIISAKQRIAHTYTENLKDIKGLTLPHETPSSISVCWLYTILVEDSFGMSRDELMCALSDSGIDTRPVFIPIHMQPVYATDQCLPVAENISVRGISLPSAVNLRVLDIKEITNIIRHIRNFK